MRYKQICRIKLDNTNVNLSITYLQILISDIQINCVIWVERILDTLSDKLILAVVSCTLWNVHWAKNSNFHTSISHLIVHLIFTPHFHTLLSHLISTPYFQTSLDFPTTCFTPHFHTSLSHLTCYVLQPVLRSWPKPELSTSDISFPFLIHAIVWPLKTSKVTEWSSGDRQKPQCVRIENLSFFIKCLANIVSGLEHIQHLVCCHSIIRHCLPTLA